MKKLLFLFALLVTAVVLLSSCGTQRGGTQQVGEMQRESRSIQAQDAQAVRSKLQMGAGELNITGGADQLMEGEFSYNVSNWKPKVSYDVSGERGALTVKRWGRPPRRRHTQRVGH
jgi:predicted small secreted protein